MVDALNQSVHKEQQYVAVIQLLSDGKHHSGQKIAEALGVSRAYVWKLIQQLQEYGLELESVQSKGYVWNSPSTLLNDNRLAPALEALKLTYDYTFVTDSTNQRLKEKFKQNHIAVTEYQTSGRGRRGRQWQSPLASNLYFSYGWKTDTPIQQLGGLSLVVGISIVQALEKLEFSKLQLKWPNDIRCERKKLSGILIELSGDANGELEVIIGVGLNVNMTQENSNIDQDWVSLAKLNNAAMDRQKILLTILKTLQANLLDFEHCGFKNFIELWNQYDETFGQEVVLLQSQHNQSGIAKGVDSNGALLLQIDDQLTPIYAGEVSLRIK